VYPAVGKLSVERCAEQHQRWFRRGRNDRKPSPCPAVSKTIPLPRDRGSGQLPSSPSTKSSANSGQLCEREFWRPAFGIWIDETRGSIHPRCSHSAVRNSLCAWWVGNEVQVYGTKGSEKYVWRFESWKFEKFEPSNSADPLGRQREGRLPAEVGPAHRRPGGEVATRIRLRAALARKLRYISRTCAKSSRRFVKDCSGIPSTSKLTPWTGSVSSCGFTSSRFGISCRW
jgi:hypothetical protein